VLVVRDLCCLPFLGEVLVPQIPHLSALDNCLKMGPFNGSPDLPLCCVDSSRHTNRAMCSTFAVAEGRVLYSFVRLLSLGCKRYNVL
jgi:hypothetical protein